MRATEKSLGLSKDTLLLIPCSGAKRAGIEPRRGSSILSVLDPVNAVALSGARSSIANRAAVDERTLLPAFRRYSGQLYLQSAAALENALQIEQPILIVSGAYGLLHADEPIGLYEKRFAVSDWPNGLLEKCLLDFVRRKRIRSVIAVMSHSTDYAKFVRRVDWAGAGVAVTLVSPVSSGGGAMVKVPRAQGEAIAKLIDSGLNGEWQSSDSLSLRIEIPSARRYV